MWHADRLPHTPQRRSLSVLPKGRTVLRSLAENEPSLLDSRSWLRGFKGQFYAYL